jgi:hypothetical protein
LQLLVKVVSCCNTQMQNIKVCSHWSWSKCFERRFIATSYFTFASELRYHNRNRF